MSAQMLKTACKWQVTAASICGRSHQKLKQLCQDAHYWKVLPPEILVTAVADGAGSASLGKVGAIVAAQTAVETISAKSSLPSLEDGDSWKLLLVNALDAARTAVEIEAAACGTKSRELATTLIILIATPKFVAAAQIGDGVAVVGDRQGNLLAITVPRRGEYANETTFLISPFALNTAQINLWQGAPVNIAVLSDGLQMLALDMRNTKPYSPFFAPLFRFVANTTNAVEARGQLVELLRSERIAKRTDDDLTLLLATLV